MADWEKGYQDWLEDTIKNFDISDFFKQKSKEEFMESEYVSDLPLDKDASYGDFLKEIKKTKKYETEDYPGKGLDVGGEIGKIREQRKKEALEGLAKGIEQRGFVGEEYNKYDRPRKDIEMDLLLTKPKIKPGPEKELSMWQKIGKHFGENADKRDQLFSMLGSMGRELVKPIEPGQAAAGALVPTLSRGLEKSEAQWAAKQSAAAETALKYAEARQKMSPMQYMTNNMKDAAAYVSGLGIDPNTAAGRAEISKYLVTVGISPAIVSMQEALTNAEEALQLYMMGGQVDENVTKEKKLIITNYRNKLNNMLEGSLGGSAVTQSTDDETIYAAGAKPSS